jgi:predicted histidine transporter YuiF (NhaC family)
LSKVIFLNFCFAQGKIPETIEEAKEVGEKVAKETKEKLPGIFERIWKEEILPIFKKIGNWLKNIWNSYIFPKIKAIFQKILSFFGKEIKKRKPQIKEEFEKEKEKEEMKKEIKKTKESLWQRFREIISNP